MEYLVLRVVGAVVVVGALVLSLAGTIPELAFWVVMLLGFVAAALLNRAEDG